MCTKLEGLGSGRTACYINGGKGNVSDLRVPSQDTGFREWLLRGTLASWSRSLRVEFTGEGVRGNSGRSMREIAR